MAITSISAPLSKQKQVVYNVNQKLLAKQFGAAPGLEDEMKVYPQSVVGMVKSLLKNESGIVFITIGLDSFNTSNFVLKSGYIIDVNKNIYYLEGLTITPTAEGRWGHIELELVATDSDSVTLEFIDPNTNPKTVYTNPANTKKTYAINVYENYNTSPSFNSLTAGRIELCRFKKDAAFGNITEVTMVNSGQNIIYDVDVVDNFTSTSAIKPLSAYRGKLLYISSKKVGELFWMDDYQGSSADFPAYCLNQETGTISTTNYPDLVAYLRSKKITWNLSISTWSVTNWSIVSNIATLTLSKNSDFTGTVSATDSTTLTFSSSQTFSIGDILSLSNGSFVKVITGSGTSWTVDINITISAGTGRVLTKEELVLRGLAEDLLVYGSYSNWRTVTLANQIGDIVAGDYAITDINTTNNTVKFAYTATNNSGSGSYTVEFYPNRVVGSSTNARIFKNQARTLYTIDNFDYLAGLMKRNTMQGFTIYARDYMDGNASSPGSAFYPNNRASIYPATDGINGTPRTGKNTSADSYAAYLYIWAGQYNP